ncbi:MAG: hypothetical protein L0Y38_07935, partial [Methylococcaceae bacterium]|nr:hypothetical protein [Methylococcaceae bacterium]
SRLGMHDHAAFYLPPWNGFSACCLRPDGDGVWQRMRPRSGCTGLRRLQRSSRPVYGAWTNSIRAVSTEKNSRDTTEKPELPSTQQPDRVSLSKAYGIFGIADPRAE